MSHAYCANDDCRVCEEQARRDAVSDRMATGSVRHVFVGHPAPNFGCGHYEGGDPDAAWAYCGKSESDPVHLGLVCDAWLKTRRQDIAKAVLAGMTAWPGDPSHRISHAERAQFAIAAADALIAALDAPQEEKA